MCTGLGAFADADGLQFHVEVKWRLSIDGKQWTHHEKTTLNKIKPCLRRTFPCFAWQPYVPKDILIWQAVGPCLKPQSDKLHDQCHLQPYLFSHQEWGVGQRACGAP